MNTASFIPLSKLVAWDGNVRKTGATDGLEELKASIAAHGLLQSLVVRKAKRGKFSVIAGRRRFLALSALARDGKISADADIACQVIAGTADATEISLAENVVRAPMHPADQFDAFRNLIEGGASLPDVAARFGVSEAVVKKRLKLARVNPLILDAYRRAELSLDQVQAFAISDDHAAQERVFSELSSWRSDPDHIRSALTQDEIPATDKRVRLVTLASYEKAGGDVRRDLFSDHEDGIFILDAALLDRLVRQTLESAAETVRAEGWKWVEIHAELDYETRAQFQHCYPEPVSLPEEDAAELERLVGEYDTLYQDMADDDEEASARLDAIQNQIDALQDRERAYSPENLALAGAIVTLAHGGQIEVLRGLVRPEDAPKRKARAQEPEGGIVLSASLTESLTAQKSASISALLAQHPDTALAAVVHALALRVFHIGGGASSLQVSATPVSLREACGGVEALEETRASWSDRIPGEPEPLWQWCLTQDRDALLQLLAFCAACTVNAVQAKQDHPQCDRLAHGNALASALKLDMRAWFTPKADNFFSRISRTAILAAVTEAKGKAPKASSSNLKKSELALLAEREMTGTGWLPSPLKVHVGAVD